MYICVNPVKKRNAGLLFQAIRYRGCWFRLFSLAALAGCAGSGAGRGDLLCRRSFFFLLEEAKAQMDRVGGAGCSAFSAADAFCRLRIFDRIDIHSADAGALAAAHTLVFIHCQAIEADLIEQTIDRTEWTEELAEEAIDNHAACDGDDQQRELPVKEPANRLLQFGVRAQQWNAARQRAGGTDVLTECRLAHADDIGDGYRHDADEYDQNDVFEILCKRRQAQLLPGQRNFTDDFLNQTERAQETAHKAAQKHADCQQEAYDIETEIKFPGAGNRLKRADRTGNRSRRT